MTIAVFVSVTGLLIIHLYPELHREYLIPMFFALGGTSIGTILGTNVRNRKHIHVAKTIFFRVLIICLSCVILSIAVFLFSKNKGLVEILIINLVGLVISIWILIKIGKQGSYSDEV
jgi:drug/metabolite transporter (DMT)-like permease